MTAIEINGTLYECSKELALLFEWIRLEEHRVRVKKFMHPKPLVGYIRCRPKHTYTGKASRPLVVYNKRSRLGRWLDEDMLESISYSNKAKGGALWTRADGVLVEFDLPLVSYGSQD